MFANEYVLYSRLRSLYERFYKDKLSFSDFMSLVLFVTPILLDEIFNDSKSESLEMEVGSETAEK